MNNDFFSQEIIGILKIGFAQLLASAVFIGSGILNLKKNRKFGFLLLIIGLLFIMFIFLFNRVMFNKSNISDKPNVLPVIFSMFMLGIPQILLGIPLAFIGISRVSRPESKKSGILFLVLAGALVFTFVWFLIFFSGSSGM